MSGVMSNIQYMPSPHGVSKRIRLSKELNTSNTFQETDHGYLDTQKEPNNIDVLQRNNSTTHIWMKNRQLQEDGGNDVYLLSGVGGLLDTRKQPSTVVIQDIEKRVIFRDLVNTTFNKTSNEACKDLGNQPLNLSVSNSQNTTCNENVKPIFSFTKSAMVKEIVIESNCSTLSSEEIRQKCANVIQINDIKCATSSTLPVSDSVTCFKDGVFENEDESCKEAWISNALNGSEGNSKNSKMEKKVCVWKNEKESNDELQYNHHNQDTVNISNEHKRESQFKNIYVRYLEDLSESTDKSNTLSYVENVIHTKAVSIERLERIGEYDTEHFEVELKKSNGIQNQVCNSENFDDNTNYKQTNIDSGLHELSGNKMVVKKLTNSEHFKLENRVFSIKTQLQIARCLPDYRLFSNVIQRAMNKVKHPEKGFKLISQNENTQLNKNSNIFNEVKIFTDENIIAQSQLSTLFRDLEQLEDFVEYAGDKISEMILLIFSATKEMQSIAAEAEDISMSLHHIRQTQILSKLVGKEGTEDYRIIASNHNEIEILGDNLTKKIHSFERYWIEILTAYKTNLVIVSRTVYMLCSFPIESKLSDKRDLVFLAVQQVDDEIKRIEVKEKELSDYRACKFAEFLELHCEIGRFQQLEISLEDFFQKYCST